MRPAPITGPGRRVARVGAALLAGAVLGWLVAGLADGLPAPRTAATTWAVLAQLDAPQVTSDRNVAGVPERRVAAGARVVVSNPSGEPVTARMLPAGLTAVRSVRAADDPLRVPPQADAVLALDLEVACRSHLPLDLPDLLVRDALGVTRMVPVTGATAALVRACATGDPGSLLLASAPPGQDEERLRVDLQVAGGRSLRLVQVRAGTVPLAAAPVPRPLDGSASTVWLAPPATCPAVWRRTGLPTRLELVTEELDGLDPTRGRARIEISLGATVPSWLLRTACPAGGAG